MGWEFAALWADEPDRDWHWVWRRVADDSAAPLQVSERFASIEECVEDAKRHGFDDPDCPVI